MPTIGWQHKNRFGTWTIRHSDGRWRAYWNDEYLDGYHRADAALDELLGGHIPWPSSGINPADCGLPEELADWDEISR